MLTLINPRGYSHNVFIDGKEEDNEYIVFMVWDDTNQDGTSKRLIEELSLKNVFKSQEECTELLDPLFNGVDKALLYHKVKP
jgi:hypothetical protein